MTQEDVQISEKLAAVIYRTPDGKLSSSHTEVWPIFLTFCTKPPDVQTSIWLAAGKIVDKRGVVPFMSQWVM